MSPKTKNIISICLLSVYPLIIMLPFAIIYKRSDLIEVGYILMAISEFFMMNMRFNRKERDNMKKYGRYKTTEMDEGYKEYKHLQNKLLISGIINVVISLLVFAITADGWFK